MDLENRVAVISGATGSTGWAAARSLAEHGARLALISTNPERLHQMAQEIDLEPGRVLLHPADLRDGQAAQAAARAVLAAYGQVDILVQLVGGWTGGKFLVDAAAEDLETMLNQHAWTTFHLLQAFVPPMLAGGWGRVIAVSSPSAVNPPAKGGLYAAGKAAEEALLLSLAKELTGSGVTANIIQVRTIDAQRQRDSQPTSTNAGWTTPEEIAAAVLYLCSPQAGVMNGARLPMFGAG